MGSFECVCGPGFTGTGLECEGMLFPGPIRPSRPTANTSSYMRSILCLLVYCKVGQGNIGNAWCIVHAALV